MADQAQSPASQQSVAVTGLTYPAGLSESPFAQEAARLGLTVSGVSTLVSGLAFPVVIGGEPTVQARAVLQLQVLGASVALTSSAGSGGPTLPTTGQIWPSGFG